MEKSCYKCGHTMDEGRPFCPHCGAPQIRVLIAEPAGATISTAEAAAIPQMSASLPASQTVPVLAVPMQWSQALKPCTLAAGVASLLMLLGLNPFVGMVSVGFLAVVFYRQGRPQASIRPGTGARLGALSGLICFAMASIVEAMLVLVLHKGAEIRQALLAAINQAAARTSDAQALAMFEHFRSPEGLEFLMVFGLLFGLVAAIVLAALSGALGGAVLGPRRKP
jgi:RNA polymerase subunit RPABC4/transcription elongation factor Spt4